MIDFETLRIANKTRCAELWEREGATPWTGADWGNEMGGECGEAQNVIKKLRRIETGIANIGDADEAALLAQLGEELADVLICADLVAQHYGVDLTAALPRKFNKTSAKWGVKTVLPE